METQNTLFLVANDAMGNDSKRSISEGSILETAEISLDALEENKPFVFGLNDGTFIVRTIAQSIENKIFLTTLNPDKSVYPDQWRQLSEIQSVYRIEAVITSEIRNRNNLQKCY